MLRRRRDACDDDDGFPDGEDPGPVDPNNPGDFSSPEAILGECSDPLPLKAEQLISFSACRADDASIRQ